MRPTQQGPPTRTEDYMTRTGTHQHATGEATGKSETQKAKGSGAGKLEVSLSSFSLKVRGAI